MSKVFKPRIIPQNWYLKKVSEIAKTGSGGTPLSTFKDYYVGGDIPWINSGEVGQNSIKKTTNFITIAGLQNSSAKIFPADSVLIALYGATAGKTSLLEIDATTNQAVCAIMPKKGYDAKFIKYYLDVLYSYLVGISTGSARDNLNQNGIQDLEIPFPSENIQKSIAKVLSELDAKIELNNKINRELETMAKTVYDYWFVQFDFPNEQGKPYKSSGGKMVFNAELKREIPEGWEVKTLAKWIKTDKSGDWGKESEEGNYQMKVSCVRGADLNGLNGNGEQKPPTRFILENNSNKLLENHDLIVEISGGSPTQSTGRLAFITGETLLRFPNPLICSNFCKALTLKEEKYLYNFVYQWNRIYDNGVLFGWEGKTSGIKNLLFESFVTNHKEAYPKSEIVAKFYDFAKPLHSQKQKNLIQNQQLSELRDWLLPMLMNGQVTVKEAEERPDYYRESMAAEPSIMYHIKANNNSK
jgi:type I restriction enzyme S subunit